jgi:serine/threonine protein kinase
VPTLFSVLSLLPCPGQVYEVFLTPQHLAIAMEFGDAGSLLAYLQRQPGRRVPEAAARWLFQQVVIGLSYTHQRVSLDVGEKHAFGVVPAATCMPPPILVSAHCTSTPCLGLAHPPDTPPPPCPREWPTAT